MVLPFQKFTGLEYYTNPKNTMGLPYKFIKILYFLLCGNVIRYVTDF